MTLPGKIVVLTPRSAISGYFESLGQDVDRFPWNGGNRSGSATGTGVTPIVLLVLIIVR